MKRVFITGAGAGIGKATAELFARKGYFVGLYDVDLEAVESLRDKLDTSVAMAGVCDVTDANSVRKALHEFAQVKDGIDIVVNNAGVLHGGKFEDVPLQQHHQTIDVNVKGLTDVAYEAYPYLAKSDEGCLVNVSSLSSVHGVPLLGVYSASKFYVRGLTEALNIEWQAHGVRVTSVMPPFVKTNLMAGVPSQLTNKMGVNLSAHDVALEINKAVKGSDTHYVLSAKGMMLKRVIQISGERLSRELMRYIAGYREQNA